MQGFTKENFFDAMAEKYPDAMKKFTAVIDSFKVRTKWTELFKDGVKFHDLPYEMQFGVLLSFFHIYSEANFADFRFSMKLFEDLFQCMQLGTPYFDPTNDSIGVSEIAVERRQQVWKHGYTRDDDKANNKGEMVNVAVALALSDSSFYPKWWEIELWEKMGHKSRKERLAIAGALIAAEIDLITDEEKLEAQKSVQA